MREAWRIVLARRVATAFTGEGAARTGGRWNSPGVRAVYCSGTLSLAALETLVHLNPFVPLRYKVFRLEFPETLIEWLPADALPRNWRTYPPPPSTKRVGDAWARSARSAVLAVPIVIIPDELNFVLNPAHPDFKRVKTHPPEDFVFDARLLPLK